MWSYNPREPLFLAPAPPESHVPICPVCGNETDTFYQTRDNDIIGCPECISRIDAYEHEEEQEQLRKDESVNND